MLWCVCCFFFLTLLRSIWGKQSHERPNNLINKREGEENIGCFRGSTEKCGVAVASRWCKGTIRYRTSLKDWNKKQSVKEQRKRWNLCTHGKCASFFECFYGVLPFLIFLLGHIVIAGRSDVSAQLKGVTCRVVDKLKTVTTKQNASKPTGNDYDDVFYV